MISRSLSSVLLKIQEALDNGKLENWIKEEIETAYNIKLTDVYVTYTDCYNIELHSEFEILYSVLDAIRMDLEEVGIKSIITNEVEDCGI